MKAVVFVCAGIALIASIVAVNLRLELRKERAITAVLQGHSSEALTPIDHAALPRPQSTSPTTVAAVTAAEDPEDQKLQLAQLRTSIERFYPGLAQELGLSEKDADRLIDLLAENQLARTADGSPLAASERKLEDSIQTLLGSRYTQWQAYQQTRGVRPQVAAMVTQLARVEGSLSALQINGLTTDLIAERQRQLKEGMSNPQALPGNPADPGYREQMTKESLKRTEENNHRILEVAALHLNATQLATLRKQLQRQTSVSR
jgi:hypothetical protein